MIDDVLGFTSNKLIADTTLDSSQIAVGHVKDIEEENKLLISVINIEEETTLKNQPVSVRIGGQLSRKEPPVFINLYILFTAANSIYNTALNRLSEVIIFFQHKRYFSAVEESDFPDGIEKITFEMYSLKLEELNHLWGILGGVYYPSVLYKVRVLRMEADEVQDEAEITEVQVETNTI